MLAGRVCCDRCDSRWLRRIVTNQHGNDYGVLNCFVDHFLDELGATLNDNGLEFHSRHLLCSCFGSVLDMAAFFLRWSSCPDFGASHHKQCGRQTNPHRCASLGTCHRWPLQLVQNVNSKESGIAFGNHANCPRRAGTSKIASVLSFFDCDCRGPARVTADDGAIVLSMFHASVDADCSSPVASPHAPRYSANGTRFPSAWQVTVHGVHTSADKP